LHGVILPYNLFNFPVPEAVMFRKRQLVIVLMLLLAACVSPLTQTPGITSMPMNVTIPASTPDPAHTPIEFKDVPLTSGYGMHGAWLDLYFTDPFNPASAKKVGGPNKPLTEAINAARLSVDVAVYSLNLWNIRDALIGAFRRGVEVRLVMETDNMDAKEVQQLIDAGIPIIGDGQPGLMHDKFTVIDRQDVWTGSLNYTVNGAYSDNNNLIHIHSEEVARDYTTEFNEMFDGKSFGPSAVANTPFPNVDIGGTKLEIYFAPDDKPAKRILELLTSAKENIYFIAYSFTNDDFANALITQSQAGLDVKGVMDDGQVKSNEGTDYDKFAQAGMNILLDGNEDGLLHHKVFIIDRSIVITGSYNFSNNAEFNNDENVVIIFSPEVAEKYIEEFQRVYDEAARNAHK
jgi:phosphatidylserine/phosphatidylglycerophosphate/cardiolipin synthase-like enzyme